MPSCETDGVERYTYLKDSDTFVFEVTLSAIGHNFGEWEVTTDPTTTTEGTLTRVCAHDHDHTETHTLPALSEANGYTYTVVTAPTCTTDGLGRYTITVDGLTFTFEVTLSAIGHSFGEWEVTTDPTTTTEGTLTRVCEHDHEHTETFTLPAISEENGYVYEVEIAPTCTTEGTGRYTITIDGQTFSFDITLPAIGHNYGDWTVTVVPTYSTTGLLTRVCEHDHEHKETFTLPKLSTSNGYTYEVLHAPSCTTEGEAIYKYVKDGKLFAFDVLLPKTGHDFGKWTVTKVPTATSTGTITRVCKNNKNHTETFILPRLSTSNGYTYEVIKAATCTNIGTGRYLYRRDGQAIVIEVKIPAIGHSFGDWALTHAPTATETGLLTKVCDLNSEHKETHILPKLSTSNGYTYSVTKEATCTEIGKAKFIYTIDEKTFEFEVDLPKTEHKHTEVRGAKTATCNEEGYTGDVYCKDCGTLLEKGRAIEKPKHHDFENGVCKICGTPDGSIDNDEIKVTVNVETDGNELVYVIDLTSKKNPTEILANLKTVFENAAHDNASIKVIFGKVTIFFNKNATKLINNTSEIPLSIIKVTDKSETSGDYAKAGFDLNNSQIYEISLGKATFEGEEVTVSIQYGTDGKEIKVYYVDKDGNKTEVQSTYDKESGTVTFTTTHFSTYIIYDAQNANEGEDEDTPKDDTNNLFILVTAISITVLIASAGAVTFYFTTKSKKQEK